MGWHLYPLALALIGGTAGMILAGSYFLILPREYRGNRDAAPLLLSCIALLLFLGLVVLFVAAFLAVSGVDPSQKDAFFGWYVTSLAASSLPCLWLTRRIVRDIRNNLVLRLSAKTKSRVEALVVVAVFLILFAAILLGGAYT